MDALEDTLAERLHRIDQVLSFESDPADDVRRGRSRLRRRRAFTVVGAAAAVAGISSLALVVSGSGDAGEETRVVGRPSASAPTSPAADPACSTAPEDPLAGMPGMRDPVTAARLAEFRDILAEHLDPQGRHLEERPSNVQGGSGQGACPPGQSMTTSLGTKLGWSTAGDDGLGMVQVEVSVHQPARDSQIHLGHEGWRQRTVDLPGVASALVTSYDGGVAVLVTRTDGVVVGLDANVLFGNNSLVPVEGMDIGVDELLAAAADPRFTLG